MTPKAFFAKVQEKLMAHMKAHRPEQVEELARLKISSFEHVLVVLTALMERDARTQEDIKRSERELAALAKEMGLDEDDLKRIVEESENDGDNG